MLQARYRDLPDMVNILDLAFAADPHIAWFTGQPGSARTARRRRRVLFRLLACAAISTGQAWLSDDRQAVALWKRHDSRPAGLRYFLANLAYLATMGIKLTGLSLAMEDQVAARMPPGPWLFLWSVGVHPERQGQGRFKTLVTPLLDQARAQGMPVLLETTLDNNVAIYRHHGFVLTDRYRFRDSPEVLVMRRD